MNCACGGVGGEGPRDSFLCRLGVYKLQRGLWLDPHTWKEKRDTDLHAGGGSIPLRMKCG